MTPEQAAALREPFPDELVGKLPRVWCGACRDARGKVCSNHSKTRCADCGNNITSAHLHLDYVGHADVTDRLLAVDPQWTWEPLAVDTTGLPVLDRVGGLWIRLTILDVTRPGYGHADGKQGGDAIKEAIGDGIRNASMRFGIALDLWRKEKPAVDDGGAVPARSRRSPAKATVQSASATARPMSDPQRRKLMALYGRAGITERQGRLDFAAAVLGRPLESSSEMSFDDCGAVITALEAAEREPTGHDDGPST